jgi:hypothetical protein
MVALLREAGPMIGISASVRTFMPVAGEVENVE